jgi:hypothetical protein
MVASQLSISTLRRAAAMSGGTSEPTLYRSS